MTFQTALSGLAAATADIRVTSNNIANANTTAFKSSRAEFADLFTGDPAQLGAGVRLAGIRQDFTQGNIDTTERQLDLAIKGRGFFVLSSDEGRSFSRAGAFGVTATGFVENAEARRLQVYPALATGGFNQGTLADLQIQSSTSPPVASTSVDMVVNLPATAVPPAAAPFDPTDPDTYNHSTSTVVFDSLGVAHTATYFFARTAGGWNVATTIDGAAVGTPQALTFTSTGQLATPAGGSVAFGPFTPGNGADPLDVSLDLDRTTQFGGNFSVASITPDGQTEGRLRDIQIDQEGIVFARFSNCSSASLGKIALADFNNVEGLTRVGDSSFQETRASGVPTFGEATESTFGSVQSGALEASNVDLAEQLVRTITAQRAFQANAQVISAVDEITQTIINVR
jgi:flagellar hook protein FlgE